MSVDALVNLAMRDRIVVPYERATMVDRDRLVAIWCERERGYQTLYERIVVSRLTARELRRPLAIYTDDDLFDTSVTGVIEFYDQWWMRCSREPGETLEAVRERYTQALTFCPVNSVVLIVGMDPPGVTADEQREHLHLCLTLAAAHDDVIGFVWVGPLPTLLEVVAGGTLPLPPKISDVEDVQWGGETQP